MSFLVPPPASPVPLEGVAAEQAKLAASASSGAWAFYQTCIGQAQAFWGSVWNHSTLSPADAVAAFGVQGVSAFQDFAALIALIVSRKPASYDLPPLAGQRGVVAEFTNPTPKNYSVSYGQDGTVVVSPI